MGVTEIAPSIDELEARLTLISDRIAEAVVAVCGDPGASSVLRAVFEELLRKSEASLNCVECGRFSCFRERIIALEQAADSARAAAAADEGADERTQERIIAAHDALRDLKAVSRCGLRQCEAAQATSCG